MIDRSRALPITKQARRLGIGRGSVYYLPRPVSSADLAIMRRIDELQMDIRSLAAACSVICLVARVSRLDACTSRR